MRGFACLRQVFADASSSRVVLVEALPQAWRNVIVSKYIDHKKGKEICQELDITPSNLWQMAHRAKLQLKTCLDTNWRTD